MAYEKIHQNTAITAQSLVLDQLRQGIEDALSEAAFSEDDGIDDGLMLVPEAGIEPPASVANMELHLPANLGGWLRDLALLRGVPLAYLIPDPRLLPLESIRLFHVDRGWVDRMIDGALSAANLGSLDMTYRLHTMVGIRDAIDESLDELVRWPGDEDHGYTYTDHWTAHEHDLPITGMLIRSELVRRWPELIVDGFRVDGALTDIDQRYRQRVRLLRKELLAKDLMIVLFAGSPRRIEVREPNVAVRFGVEAHGSGHRVNRRAQDGTYVDDQFISVGFGDAPRRVLDVGKLADDIVPGSGAAPPSWVGLCLEQLPYVQVFEGGKVSDGSKVAGVLSKIPSRVLGQRDELRLRNGHRLQLANQATASTTTLNPKAPLGAREDD